jgi:hypothetical protein
MTEHEIAALGPAFAAELRTYRHCVKRDRTAKHFDTYCRGLLADLPRCRAAGIPDAVRYRSKWRVALDQLIRLGRNGVRFDWLVFDVVSTAYERTSVIGTTNLPFEQWTEVLGSEQLVGATLDRLTHRCHILEATGESDRLREAKRRHGTVDGPRAAKERSSDEE